MNVYINSNHDGRNSTMVAAPTMVEAAKLLKTSTHHMREYGWRRGNADEVALATASPGQVFWRKIMDDGPWLTERPVR